MEVREGEITALIGPNGAGKTTLFNAVSRLQPLTTGRVFFEGTDITDLSPSEAARAGMARTFQNLRIFVNMSVLENVLVGCHRHERSGICVRRPRPPQPARRGEARLVSGRWGRSSCWASRSWLIVRQPACPTASNGSWRSRVPSPPSPLLMLDEPAAGMNAGEREYLVEKIARIRDAGVTVLLVEHDIGLVMGISDSVNVPRLRQAHRLRHGQGQCRRTRRSSRPTSATASRRSCVSAPRSASWPRRTTSSWSTASRRPTATIQALHGVSLMVPKGQIVAVLGANGAGKTTLLETISGLRPGRAAVSHVPGRRHHQDGAATASRARGLGHVPEGRQLFPTLSVEDNLIMGATGATTRQGSPTTWRSSTRCSRYSASGASRTRGRCRVASSRCWRSAGP